MLIFFFFIFFGKLIYMFNHLDSHSVKWGSWFSVVKLDIAFPISWFPDGIIRAIYIHGIVVEYQDNWFKPSGLYYF